MLSPETGGPEPNCGGTAGRGGYPRRGAAKLHFTIGINVMRDCYRLLIGIALAAAFAAPASAQSGGTKVGVLTCKTSTRIGLVLGSHQRMRCSYAPDNGGRPEYYYGYINRLGLDLGITTGGVLAWGVVAPTEGV